MKTLVSTKTGAVMSFLAGEVAAICFQEGLPGQSPPHRLRIVVLGGHALLQNARQKARDTHVFLGSLNASPAGYFFFQGQRDIAQVSHTRYQCNTNLVYRKPESRPSAPEGA